MQVTGVIDADVIWRLGAALLIGLLIGLERGWQDRTLPEGRRVAGFRTCAVVSLLGAVGALLTPQIGGIGFAALLLTLGVLLAAGYWQAMRATSDFSVTTMIAVLAAFALGALAGIGEILPAAAAAVAVTLILGLKPELHGLLNKIERLELLATLRLLVITVAVLPLLPNQGYGPWQALNPYRLWWMVVLIAGISYVGYFAIRLAGTQRGVLLTGGLGGLVSSTATTVTFSRSARERPASAALFAAGAVLASTVMVPRLAVLVALLAPAVLRDVLAAFVPALAAGGLAVAWLTFRAQRGQADSSGFAPGNPLNLRMALQFGLLLTLLSVLVRAAEEWLGAVGLLALAAVSGIADADAIILSLTSEWDPARLDGKVIALAVLIAAGVNTMVKAGLALSIGGPRMGGLTAGALAAMLLAGGLGFAFA
jgi:uncharacterized membrane protein (DUF4010 family)